MLIATATSLLSGLYFLSSLTQSTYLQFGGPGGNLTTWRFSGGETQQWDVMPSGTGYKIQNKAYGGFITSKFELCPTKFNAQVACQSDYAQIWYIKKAPYIENGFIISADPRFQYSLNVMGGSSGDGNPIEVIIYLLDAKASNAIFVAVPTNDPNLSSPPPTQSPSNTGNLSNSDIIALAIGIPGVLVTAYGVFLGIKKPNYRQKTWGYVAGLWKNAKGYLGL